MKVIVAGGTSPTLGQSLVTACRAAGHEVTILSRASIDADSNPTKYDAPIRYVNYDDPDSIKRAIEGAEVVISVIKIVGDLQLSTHLNLLRASLENSDRPTICAFRLELVFEFTCSRRCPYLEGYSALQMLKSSQICPQGRL